MSAPLSVNNVPDAHAQRLRMRVVRHRRPLQREPLAILEAAADERGPSGPALPPRERMAVEALAARARERVPKATAISVAYIRQRRALRQPTPRPGSPRRPTPSAALTLHVALWLRPTHSLYGDELAARLI